MPRAERGLLDAVLSIDLPARRHELIRHPVVLAVGSTCALALLWIVFLPTLGTDLSAQIARADFASRYPHAAYDFSWYGGVYPAAYSVVAPYVFAVFGTRITAAAAAVVCAGVVALLFHRHGATRPRAAALWAAFAVWTGLLAGRATFTLGLASAVCAVAVADSERIPPAPRWFAAGILSVLAGLLSPVAGLFIGVAAAALFLTGRRAEGLVLGGTAVVPLAVTAVLFGAGGVQPITVLNLLPTLIAAGLVFFMVPKGSRVIRVATVIYAVGVLATWVVPNALGSNVERLGLLLIGPLIIGTAQRRKWPIAMVAALAVIWQVADPVRDIAHGDPPVTATADTEALVDQLVARHVDRSRLEAVPQYGHWEAQQLAGVVPLARGWERQIDTQRNALFYSGVLTPDEYHDWLRHNAVGYVAISVGPTDYAAAAEAVIVRSGQPWLRPVWRDGHWALYRVLGSEPLASAPATVQSTTPERITLRMPAAGRTTVRVHWSSFLRANGGGQLRRSGEWTALRVPAAGTYTLAAPY